MLQVDSIEEGPFGASEVNICKVEVESNLPAITRYSGHLKDNGKNLLIIATNFF